jgi:hypothetical protein
MQKQKKLLQSVLKLFILKIRNKGKRLTKNDIYTTICDKG